jgi:hypothetical protein
MKKFLFKSLLVSGALVLVAPLAQAIPSFARQTGVACAGCHTVFPKLNAFGRQFKLNGYTMTGMKQIEFKSSSTESGLKINDSLPFSTAIQVGVTHVNKLDKTVGSSVQNNAIGLPSVLALYYGGEITPNMGIFAQMNLNDGTGFSLDMMDMRYAKSTMLGGKSLTYGFTFNNGTGMADLWNTTPAWTFPYLASGAVDPGLTEPQLSGMSMGMAGLGVYSMLDNHFYSNFTLYRTAKLGGAFPNKMGSVSGFAPYWRFAYQNNFSNGGYLELGTYGMQSRYDGGMMGSTGGIIGKNDKYTDYAFDAQYSKPMGNNLMTLHAINVNEKQNLDSTAPGTGAVKLHQIRLDGTLVVDGTYQFAAGLKRNSGSDSSLSSQAYQLQADYLPWQNVKFSAQYVIYGKVNGSSSGASNWNTLFLNSWFVF